ncbi:MAG: DEAD/DEAH box helicase [Chitinophagales bacterium]
MTFSDFDFNDSLLDGLEAMGFETPTPIQEQAIPLISEGGDLIACAQTGTGKTAAYLLPVINKIMETPPDNGVNTLIIAPTRELVMQIDKQVEGFGYFCNVYSISVYGGGDEAVWVQQKKGLKGGADIVVATPGRLISHLNLGYAQLKNIQHFILDEADKMLDMGFFDDIVKIVSFLPKNCQNLLFSATMPPKIRQLSKKLLTNPKQISIAISKPAEGILQAAYMVYDNQKVALVKHLVKNEKLQSILIFASTKNNVRNLSKALKAAGLPADSIHSDKEQSEREEVMRLFKNRKIKILVATDIVSRGIDIDTIGLVVNYDVPNDAEDYVHRIGRTARAASTGVALTFINDKEQRKFAKIEELIEMTINKIPLPEGMSEGPEYNPKKYSGGGGRYHQKGKGGYKGKKNYGKSRSGGSGKRNYKGGGKSSYKKRD